MFKSISVFLVIFIFQLCTCDETVSLTNDSNQNLTTMPEQSNQPFINTDLANHNLTMFAKKENNLIVNSSGSVVGVSRTGVTHNSAASSSTLILILISLVVVTCIIAIVLTALFVMRRRFTIWRLNGSKTNECNDGASGALTQASSENGLVSGVVETKTEIVNETETKPEESVEAEQKVVEQQKQEAPHLPEQTSATSLIVNVLNELSESVACKLANTPSKSANNLNAQDPEKQPLNSNEEDK